MSDRLFLVCTGLGIVKRGFETYISDLADALYEARFPYPIEVYSGGNFTGNFFTAKKILSLNRTNKFFKKLLGTSITAELELYSFFFFFLIPIVVRKPAAVYLGEYKLYCYLFKIRKLIGLNFSLILYTGGQAYPGLFDSKRDFVHHITDCYYNELLKLGIPINRQFIIPHFLRGSNYAKPQLVSLIKEKSGNKKIIISIGIIDKKIKQMDKLVLSIANEPKRFFPVILGEHSEETKEIVLMLEKYFGRNNYYVGVVPRNEIKNFLHTADIYLQLSPKESFGLAAVEAMFLGLPVICGNYPESRYVFDQMALFIDVSNPTVVRDTIEQVLNDQMLNEKKIKRSLFIQQKFSWEKLEQSYVEMFKAFVTNTIKNEVV